MYNKCKELKKKTKGITLVALVVTIIVLLILAGVTISFSLGEDGIFKKAKEGTEIYQNASKNEKVEIDKVSNYIDKYLENNEKEDEEKPIKSTLDTVTGEEKTNTQVNDKYGNKVVVPAGFKIINPDASVLDGIVIEDISAGNESAKGNQYVWVPIGDIKTNTEGSKIQIKLGRYTFDANGVEKLMQSASDYNNIVVIENYYEELINSDLGNMTAENLGEFIAKSQKSGGYYIGRFEAGKVAGDPDTFNIKKGQEVYNNIMQPNAATLARNIYSNNANFQSDLINSYAYDTAIVFIQTFSEDKDYSLQNRLQDTLTTTGNAHDSNNNYDVKCNIYDMAGNTREWTTETSTLEQSSCISRGGNYSGERSHTAGRSNDSNDYSNTHISFRSIIYL